jgi:dTDP-4-amino-4,6-dideoxygalactose transaminase
MAAALQQQQLLVSPSTGSSAGQTAHWHVGATSATDKQENTRAQVCKEPHAICCGSATAAFKLMVMMINFPLKAVDQ